MESSVFSKASSFAQLKPCGEVSAWIEQAFRLGLARVNPDASITIQSFGSHVHLPREESEIHCSNTLFFDGVEWTLGFEDLTVQDSDRLGWHYVFRLIQKPNHEIHVTNLVTEVNGESPDMMKVGDICEDDVAFEYGLDDEGNEYGQPVTAEFRDEILPDEARCRIIGWIEKAEGQLKSLQSKGKVVETALRKEDIRLTKAYLKKHRFFGKNICFSGRSEADRKSVAKAIKAAIKKIAGKHPLLSTHLSQSIKTGEYCSYRPTGDFSWKVANMA